MSVVALVFWFSSFAVIYSYLGYPMVLWFISLLKQHRWEGNQVGRLPNVSLLISVFNEEKVIEDKILNSLSLDYPRDLLEIIVLSDGSTDGTEEIVARYSPKGVRLARFDGRIGKTACLNQVVPKATGEVVVFSDANASYEKMAIRELVKGFSNPRIGFVTGWTKYVSRTSIGVSQSVGVYWQFEKIIKTLESKVGTCIGADGAIFAIRKNMFRSLDPRDINDFVIPMHVMAQGYLGSLVEKAFCFEEATVRIKEEFSRQVRINTRTIRALRNHLLLLNPLRYGMIAFQLFSHKVSRLLVPFFLMMMLFTNVLLIQAGALYVFILVTQLLFYFLGGFKVFESDTMKTGKIVSVIYTFCMSNFAIIVGWIRFARGETFTGWTPTER